MRFLEKKFGRFAIPNITGLIIGAQVLVFAAAAMNRGLIDRLLLLPKAVLAGEIHRLLTFIAIPPGLNPLWAFFAWYLFYMMGNALEQYWGTFRFNMFLLIGYVATVSVAFLVPGQASANGFIGATVFLAFAWLNPNFVINLMLIFPVRIKWLALIAWIGIGLTILSGPWALKLAAIASVTNFLIFFASDIKWRIKGQHRKTSRRIQKSLRSQPAHFHKCTTCGITDADNQEMEFRYCSKCDGDHAYCSEHLRNHEHVREAAEATSDS